MDVQARAQKMIPPVVSSTATSYPAKGADI
jgi:hypothetical protein